MNRQQPPARSRRARRLTAEEAAILTGRGEHCDTRRCRQPVAIVTWTFYTWRGHRRVSERFVCEDHGNHFARRHRLEIADA